LYKLMLYKLYSELYKLRLFFFNT